MHPQPSPEGAWQPDSDEVARIILDIVVHRHPTLIAVDELVRELTSPSLQRPIEEPVVRDGLMDLTGSGLVHRLDRFVFATRAATRAHELSL